MKVIIIEDETPAFNKLSKYLLAYKANAQVLAWYSSVEDALQEKELFNECDLVLSDIKLLDGNSFEIFHQVEFNCPIIFCTAFSQFMQNAFETNGIAYLVKPYTQQSFNQAMQKYDHFFESRTAPKFDKNTISSIEQLLQNNGKNYKQRFSIKRKTGISIKKAVDVLYFQASGDFCILVDRNDGKDTVNYKISTLEQMLDPQLFFRINRSEIVHIEYIEKVETYFKNKMQITLSNKEVLYTSGARTPEFRKWLDGE